MCVHTGQLLLWYQVSAVLLSCIPATDFSFCVCVCVQYHVCVSLPIIELGGGGGCDSIFL